MRLIPTPKIPSVRRVIVVACLLCLRAPLTAVQPKSAQLGASPDSFTAAFGTPVRSTAETRDFQKCPGRSAMAKWSVMVDGDRVTTITRNACPGETLSATDAWQEANRFIPSDAGPPTRFVSEDGWPAEHRRSISLGTALPAASFKSCKGAAARGTFSYLLSPEHSMWMLTVGTCP
jgi:hypothetical protein